MAKVHPATQLSLKALRADDRFTLVEKVESWVPFPPPGHRSDLFGILDIIAVGPGIVLGVQCTSVNGVSSRKKKISEHVNTVPLLEAGWNIEIHGWHKVGHRWVMGRYHTFEIDQPAKET